MLKTLFLLVSLALPVSFAQQFYVGAALGTPLTRSDDIEHLTDSFELGAQLGMDFLPSFGVRVSTEGNSFNSGLKLASGDAVLRYHLPLSPNSFYAGFGVDAYFSRQPDAVNDLEEADLAAHALGGVEFRLGRFGLFAEALPSYLIGNEFAERTSYYLRARSGVNFHF